MKRRKYQGENDERIEKNPQRGESDRGRSDRHGLYHDRVAARCRPSTALRTGMRPARADDRPLSALSLPRGGLLGEYALSRPRKEQMVVLEGRISRACPLRGSLLGM